MEERSEGQSAWSSKKTIKPPELAHESTCLIELSHWLSTIKQVCAAQLQVVPSLLFILRQGIVA